ncbi:MAG: ribonuclease PH [Bdellovibrionia bacterium]
MIRNLSERSLSQIRPLKIETHVNRYAEGSALIQAGHTHVLCTATIEKSVPAWMVGKGQGWITAEYAMLPRATHTRSKRDREKVSGRTQEIQRLIGRALRATVDLTQLGERSILIDCDVLQADGGTRTASITGGCVALALAVEKLILEQKVSKSVWLNTVAAVSLGIHDGQVLVDLDYQEDSTCDVDMNFVMTGRGQWVEVQGTGEKKTFSPDDLSAMTQAASGAFEQIRRIQNQVIPSILLG